MNDEALIQLAIEAKKNAYAPYSHYKVGAALLTKSGKVYTGCNVECASYGMTICAERTALVKAVSEGDMEFDKIAVVSGIEEALTFGTPCGACRQFLMEFGKDMKVIMGYVENGEIKYQEKSLQELLPDSFML